jgi:hypothetical protein
MIFCLWTTMDTPTFVWLIGFGMKSILGGNYGGGSISQITCVGDTSDGICITTMLRVRRVESFWRYSYSTFDFGIAHMLDHL